MINSMRYIVRIHKENMPLILKMALMHTQKQTVRSSLGIFWTYFHDLMYIFVFVIFRLLIAGNGQMMGMNNTVYLLTGMIPWFFINDVLSQGSMAIRSNSAIVASIRFPVPVLPAIEVISIFIKRIISFAMLFLIVFAYGYMQYFHFFLFCYYIVCSLALCLAWNLLVTAFIAISDDFRQLYDAFLRVLIYTLPVLWDFTHVKTLWANILLRVNPMVYVIKGFRDAFVLGPTQDPAYAVYFWSCVLILFGLGSYVQDKLKRYYVDFL